MGLFHLVSRVDKRGAVEHVSLYLSEVPKFPCCVPRDRAPGLAVHGWVSLVCLLPGLPPHTAGCVEHGGPQS